MDELIAMKYSLDVVDITLSSSEDDETFSEHIDKCTKQVQFFYTFKQ